MDKGLNLENLHLHCRACLTRIKGNMHLINELPSSLFQLLQETLSDCEILHEDLYPKNLCIRCYWRFKSYDEFREQCRKSQDILKEILKDTTTVSYEIEEHIIQEGNEDVQQTENYQSDTYLCDENEFIPNNSSPFEEIEFKEEVEEFIDSAELTPLPIMINEVQIQKEIHNCKICLQTFSCNSSLKNHMRTQHIDEVHAIIPLEIKCAFGCGKVFQKTETVQAHYRKKHASKGRDTQRQQKRIENNKNTSEALKNDVAQAETDNFSNILSSTTCKVCFQNCASKHSLRIHMFTHLEKRPHPCNMCEKSFNMFSILNNHIREVHSDIPVQIECKFGCGKVFHRSGTAETHYRIKHILPSKGLKPNDRSRICEDCGKVCRNISNLKEHRYQHIPLEECPYHCEKCNKYFRSKKVFSRHLERHEPIRKYECPHCGIKKALREDLATHINSHTKEKKYPCPICSKIFYNAENLRRHKLSVHLGIKKYKCRYCEQSFSKSEDRIQHESSQHTTEQNT